jgi:signal transduction histidine kinase
MSPAGREIEALTVLDSLHQHVALLDQSGVIMAVNRAWIEFGVANGASPESARSIGANYLDICCDSDDVAVDPHAATARRGIDAVLSGTLPSFEMEYPCARPGTPRWFLMRVSPLLGERSGAVVSHEDITSRWQLEQQRAGLIGELLAANRELSEFAYVVSHDLKAPLRGISSLSTWLVTDFSDKLGPTGREHLALIASRVKRLAGLIDAILAYSRAGRSRVHRQLVALDPLVHSIVDLLAPAPHVQVSVNGHLPEVHIEPVKIQQIFQNLLSNAIDFIDKPQGRVVVACVREGDHWHFTVSDNGAGIEERHFQRIFQLFQTLAARDELERTGVGLALVKKIVEIEGGRVWVESEVGVGSVFHFTLPGALP